MDFRKSGRFCTGKCVKFSYIYIKNAILMILHYSLAIWKNHDNAFSLFILANAQMSGGNPHIAGTFCLGETSYL